MSNTEVALNCISKRLFRLGFSAYKKTPESSRTGVLYEILDARSSRTFSVDIELVERYDALAFSMYPGIRVASKDYFPSLILYCQGIITPFGSVQVDRRRSEVVFRAETCYMDNLLTEKTIEVLEETGKAILEKHYENLFKISQGMILEFENVEPEKNDDEHLLVDYDLEGNIRSLKECLMRWSNTTVCESVYHGDRNRFRCQVFDETTVYIIDVAFGANGFLTFRGGVGMTPFLVPRAYWYSVTDYINGENTERRYGALKLKNDVCGSKAVYCEISTSLLDGEVSVQTAAFLKGMLVDLLRDSVQAIQTLSVGMIPHEENENKEMLDGFADYLKHKIVAEFLAGETTAFEDETDEEGDVEVTMEDFGKVIDEGDMGEEGDA